MNERDTDTDDTEGNSLKGKYLESGTDTEDTDGNVLKGKVLKPPGWISKVNTR